MMCHMLWVLALLSGGRGTRSMPQLALVHHQQLQLRQPVRLSLLLRRGGRLHSGINQMMKALRQACVCTKSLWPKLHQSIAKRKLTFCAAFSALRAALLLALSGFAPSAFGSGAGCIAPSSCSSCGALQCSLLWTSASKACNPTEAELHVAAAQHIQYSHLEEGVIEGVVIVLEESVSVATTRGLIIADVWLADGLAVGPLAPALRLGCRPLLPDRASTCASACRGERFTQPVGSCF